MEKEIGTLRLKTEICFFTVGRNLAEFNTPLVTTLKRIRGLGGGYFFAY